MAQVVQERESKLGTDHLPDLNVSGPEGVRVDIEAERRQRFTIASLNYGSSNNFGLPQTTTPRSPEILGREQGVQIAGVREALANVFEHIPIVETAQQLQRLTDEGVIRAQGRAEITSQKLEEFRDAWKAAGSPDEKAKVTAIMAARIGIRSSAEGFINEIKNNPGGFATDVVLEVVQDFTPVGAADDALSLLGGAAAAARYAQGVQQASGARNVEEAERGFALAVGGAKNSGDFLVSVVVSRGIAHGVNTGRQVLNSTDTTINTTVSGATAITEATGSSSGRRSDPSLDADSGRRQEEYTPPDPVQQHYEEFERPREVKNEEAGRRAEREFNTTPNTIEGGRPLPVGATPAGSSIDERNEIAGQAYSSAQSDVRQSNSQKLQGGGVSLDSTVAIVYRRYSEQTGGGGVVQNIIQPNIANLTVRELARVSQGEGPVDYRDLKGAGLIALAETAQQVIKVEGALKSGYAAATGQYDLNNPAVRGERFPEGKYTTLNRPPEVKIEIENGTPLPAYDAGRRAEAKDYSQLSQQAQKINAEEKPGTVAVVFNRKLGGDTYAPNIPTMYVGPIEGVKQLYHQELITQEDLKNSNLGERYATYARDGVDAPTGKAELQQRMEQSRVPSKELAPGVYLGGERLQPDRVFKDPGTSESDAGRVHNAMTRDLHFPEGGIVKIVLHQELLKRMGVGDENMIPGRIMFYNSPEAPGKVFIAYKGDNGVPGPIGALEFYKRGESATTVATQTPTPQQTQSQEQKPKTESRWEGPSMEQRAAISAKVEDTFRHFPRGVTISFSQDTVSLIFRPSEIKEAQSLAQDFANKSGGTLSQSRSSEKYYSVELRTEQQYNKVSEWLDEQKGPSEQRGRVAVEQWAKEIENKVGPQYRPPHELLTTLLEGRPLIRTEASSMNPRCDVEARRLREIIEGSELKEKVKVETISVHSGKDIEPREIGKGFVDRHYLNVVTNEKGERFILDNTANQFLTPFPGEKQTPTRSPVMYFKIGDASGPLPAPEIDKALEHYRIPERSRYVYHEMVNKAYGLPTELQRQAGVQPSPTQAEVKKPTDEPQARIANSTLKTPEQLGVQVGEVPEWLTPEQQSRIAGAISSLEYGKDPRTWPSQVSFETHRDDAGKITGITLNNWNTPGTGKGVCDELSQTAASRVLDELGRDKYSAVYVQGDTKDFKGHTWIVVVKNEDIERVRKDLSSSQIAPIADYAVIVDPSTGQMGKIPGVFRKPHAHMSQGEMSAANQTPQRVEIDQKLNISPTRLYLGPPQDWGLDGKDMLYISFGVKNGEPYTRVTRADPALGSHTPVRVPKDTELNNLVEQFNRKLQGDNGGSGTTSSQKTPASPGQTVGVAEAPSATPRPDQRPPAAKPTDVAQPARSEGESIGAFSKDGRLASEARYSVDRSGAGGAVLKISSITYPSGSAPSAGIEALLPKIENVARANDCKSIELSIKTTPTASGEDLEARHLSKNNYVWQVFQQGDKPGEKVYVKAVTAETAPPPRQTEVRPAPDVSRDPNATYLDERAGVSINPEAIKRENLRTVKGIEEELLKAYHVKANFEGRMDYAVEMFKRISDEPTLYAGVTIGFENFEGTRSDGTGTQAHYNKAIDAIKLTRDKTLAEVILNGEGMYVTTWNSSPDPINHELLHRMAGKYLSQEVFNRLGAYLPPPDVMKAMSTMSDYAADPERSNWHEVFSEYWNGVRFGQDRNPVVENWLSKSVEDTVTAVAHSQGVTNPSPRAWGDVESLERAARNWARLPEGGPSTSRDPLDRLSRRGTIGEINDQDMKRLENLVERVSRPNPGQVEVVREGGSLRFEFDPRKAPTGENWAVSAATMTNAMVNELPNGRLSIPVETVPQLNRMVYWLRQQEAQRIAPTPK